MQSTDTHPTRPRKINTCVRLPPELLEALRREAEHEERTFGDYVRRVLVAREKREEATA
jgi:hypothetical protein